MTRPPDKTALRARLRARRRSLAAATPDAAARAAALLPAAALPPFRAFAGYVAQGAEMDAGPLMRRLAAAGATPLLPFVERRDAPLAFRAWDLHAPLAPDAWGIPAPPAGIAQSPDLVIAPLLAFDRAGGRLGQGAGHYDRALESLRRRGPVFVLGLAYAGQEVAGLPMEPHDQRLDAILTETDFIPVARRS